MFVVSVTLTLHPGRMEAFLPLIRAHAGASREGEPGCRRFDVCVASDRPDQVHLHEVYNDAAAFEAHKASAHFARFQRDAGPMIAHTALSLWEMLPPD